MKLPLSVILDGMNGFVAVGEVDSSLASALVADVLPASLCGSAGQDGWLLVDGMDLVMGDARVAMEPVGEAAAKGSSEPVSEADLFLAVRSVMAAFDAWALEARRVCQMDGGLEQLLRISAPVLSDHVVVLDPSFQLMAATKDAPFLDAAGYAELLGSDLEVATRVCSYGGTLYAHVLMLPAGPHLTQGSKDALNLFMMELAPFLLRDSAQRPGFVQPHDYLFEQLLSEKGMSESEARMEAFRLQIPFEGSFKVLCVDRAPQAHLDLESFAAQLAQGLPDCRVSVHGDVALVLALGEDPVLPEGALAGCSHTFGSLSDLRFAFTQALFALDCRRSDASGVQSFEDCLVEFVLERDGSDADLLEFCLRNHPVARMRRDAKARETREYEILKEYLLDERRATLVAERLGMHRNNVLYHVRRMADGYGLNFDDPATRFEAQMVIRLLENMG